MLFKSLVILAFIFSPSIDSDASTYGQQALDQFNQLWGDPDKFVADWEADIKPMINNWMGSAVAVSGFILVVRSLVK